MTIYRISAVCIVLAAGLAFVIRPSYAQPPQKGAALEQELVKTEMGFFEAWKAKDATYFRNHIPDNGVFWGEDGTFSREQQLAAQQAAAKNCSIEGYGLSEFSMMPLASGVYLLTYKAQQYATCDGVRLPAHINGSSVYIFKDGRWQAVYRAQVPLNG
jgi:hypothetical protein